LDAVSKKFHEVYREQPLIVRSPGRVNLIGEHTDYNLGYVLPAAIDKSLYIALSPRSDGNCSVFALDKNDEQEFALEDLRPSAKAWTNYIMGVVDQFKKGRKAIEGFNCVFGGNIPIGAGLSSSAAIEAGLAFALNQLFGLKLDNLSLVKLARGAENDFVGVQCGIMDMYINIFGEQGKALLLDCRTLDHKFYPFETDYVSIVLFDTGISHALASTEYNQRRKECNTGVASIMERYPNVMSLRDVSIDMLEEFEGRMNSTIYRRCKYVVEENSRVLRACATLMEKDMRGFGSLMYETHNGLSNEYEVSCEELDFLVKLALDETSVYGSRMMGGGFGGCTISLVEKGSVEGVIKKMSAEYHRRFERDLKAYVTLIGSGTEIVSAGEYAAVSGSL
jgi:galactokinase